jgi:hypothetical protein
VNQESRKEDLEHYIAELVYTVNRPICCNLKLDVVLVAGHEKLEDSDDDDM